MPRQTKKKKKNPVTEGLDLLEQTFNEGKTKMLKTHHDFDLDADLAIDADALDVEFVQFPMTYGKYTELSAQADKASREADERLKTIRSELIKAINENPEEYTEGKVTAAVLEALYRTQPKYVKAKEEAIQAEFEAQMLRNAMFAMNAKKQGLENLVKLLSMEYFTGPLKPELLSDKIERRKRQKTKKLKGEIADSLNKENQKRRKRR